MVDRNIIRPQWEGKFWNLYVYVSDGVHSCPKQCVLCQNLNHSKETLICDNHIHAVQCLLSLLEWWHVCCKLACFYIQWICERIDALFLRLLLLLLVYHRTSTLFLNIIKHQVGEETRERLPFQIYMCSHLSIDQINLIFQVRVGVPGRTVGMATKICYETKSTLSQ